MVLGHHQDGREIALNAQWYFALRFSSEWTCDIDRDDDVGLAAQAVERQRIVAPPSTITRPSISTGRLMPGMAIDAAMSGFERPDDIAISRRA